MNPYFAGAVVAHWTAHTYNVSDDSFPGYIMNPQLNLSFVATEWSDASVVQLNALQSWAASCLPEPTSDDPLTLGDVEICGNGRVDPSEDCDPGFGLTDPCCSDQCLYVPSCPCIANQTCCSGGVISPPWTICRPSRGPCDVTDYCDGWSGNCPMDVTVPNGQSCDGGMCYAGVCEIRDHHCMLAFTSSLNFFSQSCDISSCDALHCSLAADNPQCQTKRVAVSDGVPCGDHQQCKDGDCHNSTDLVDPQWTAGRWKSCNPDGLQARSLICVDEEGNSVNPAKCPTAVTTLRDCRCTGLPLEVGSVNYVLPEIGATGCNGTLALNETCWLKCDTGYKPTSPMQIHCYDGVYSSMEAKCEVIGGDFMDLQSVVTLTLNAPHLNLFLILERANYIGNLTQDILDVLRIDAKSVSILQIIAGTSRRKRTVTIAFRGDNQANLADLFHNSVVDFCNSILDWNSTKFLKDASCQGPFLSPPVTANTIMSAELCPSGGYRRQVNPEPCPLKELISRTPLGTSELSNGVTAVICVAAVILTGIAIRFSCWLRNKKRVTLPERSLDFLRNSINNSSQDADFGQDNGAIYSAISDLEKREDQGLGPKVEPATEHPKSHYGSIQHSPALDDTKISKPGIQHETGKSTSRITAPGSAPAREVHSDFDLQSTRDRKSSNLDKSRSFPALNITVETKDSVIEIRPITPPPTPSSLVPRTQSNDSVSSTSSTQSNLVLPQVSAFSQLSSSTPSANMKSASSPITPAAFDPTQIRQGSDLERHFDPRFHQDMFSPGCRTEVQNEPAPTSPEDEKSTPNASDSSAATTGRPPLLNISSPTGSAVPIGTPLSTEELLRKMKESRKKAVHGGPGLALDLSATRPQRTVADLNKKLEAVQNSKSSTAPSRSITPLPTALSSSIIMPSQPRNSFDTPTPKRDSMSESLSNTSEPNWLPNEVQTERLGQTEDTKPVIPEIQLYLSTLTSFDSLRPAIEQIIINTDDGFIDVYLHPDLANDAIKSFKEDRTSTADPKFPMRFIKELGHGTNASSLGLEHKGKASRVEVADSILRPISSVHRAEETVTPIRLHFEKGLECTGDNVWNDLADVVFLRATKSQDDKDLIRAAADLQQYNWMTQAEYKTHVENCGKFVSYKPKGEDLDGGLREYTFVQDDKGKPLTLVGVAFEAFVDDVDSKSPPPKVTASVLQLKRDSTTDLRGQSGGALLAFDGSDFSNLKLVGFIRGFKHTDHRIVYFTPIWQLEQAFQAAKNRSSSRGDASDT